MAFPPQGPNSGYYSLTINGLGDLSFTIPINGEWFFDGKLTLPSLIAGTGQSMAVMTINQNGSPVYVGPAGATGFRASFPCSGDDLIDFVLTSSSPDDALPSAVKGTIAIGQGV